MLSDIIQLGNQLLEYKNTENKKKMDVSFISLQLYLECKINLALIDTVKINSTNDEVYTQDGGFKSIIKSLNTQYIELFLLELKINELIKKEMNKIDLSDQSNNNELNRINKKETVLQLIFKLYVKITSLQQIVKIENGGDAIKKIRFKTRLRNIQKRLLILSNKLLESSIKEYFKE